MKKWRIAIGIFVDILILAAVGYGVSNLLLGYLILNEAWPKAELLDAVQYFTVDSAVLMGIAALMSLINNIAVAAGKKPCGFVAGFKVVAVVAELITAGITVGYLVPFAKMGGWDLVYDLNYNLALHVVAPVLGLLSLIIANRPRLKLAAGLLGLVAPVLYGGVMIPLIIFGVLPKGKYPFMDISGQEWWVSAIWAGSFVLGAILLGILVVALHNIPKGAIECSAEKSEDPFVEEEVPQESVEAEEVAPQSESDLSAPAPEPGPEPQVEEPVAEEPKPEEPKPEEPKPEPKPVARPTTIRTATRRPVPVQPRPAKPKATTAAAASRVPARVYHITKQANSGLWQVKLAGGNKAIRVFNTQAEAIAFTKGLVESRGGSYRIHSVSGKIRK